MASRVLIVDDEPNIVISLEFLMKQQGYETRRRPRRRGALEVESFRPDLVLLDVMLPRKDGFEVCQKLRAGRLDGPEDHDAHRQGARVEIEKGLALGADAYVTKPFSTGELVETVARMLEARRGRLRRLALALAVLVGPVLAGSFAAVLLLVLSSVEPGAAPCSWPARRPWCSWSWDTVVSRLVGRLAWNRYVTLTVHAATPRIATANRPTCA